MGFMATIQKHIVVPGLGVVAFLASSLLPGGGAEAHPLPCAATPLFTVERAVVTPATVVAGNDNLTLTLAVTGHCADAQQISVAVALSDGHTATELSSANRVRTIRGGTNNVAVALTVPAAQPARSYSVMYSVYAGPIAAPTMTWNDHLVHARWASSRLSVQVRAPDRPRTPTPQPEPTRRPTFACAVDGAVRAGSAARLTCGLRGDFGATLIPASVVLRDAGGVRHQLRPEVRSFRLSRKTSSVRFSTEPIPTTAVLGDGGRLSVIVRVNDGRAVSWQGATRVVPATRIVGPNCQAMRSFAERLKQAFGSYWTRLSGHRLDICAERGVPGGVNFIGDVIALISPADEIRDLAALREQCRSSHPEDDCNEMAILLTAGAIIPIPAAKGVQVAGKMAPMLRWSDDVGRVIKVYASRGEWQQIMRPFHLSADRLWRHRFAPGMAELVHRLGSRSAIDASMAHATLDWISRLPAGQSVVEIGTHAGRAIPGFTIKHADGALTHVRTVSGDYLALLSNSAMTQLMRESAEISTRMTFVPTASGISFMKMVSANIVFPSHIGPSAYAAMQRFQQAAQREGVALSIPSVAIARLR